MVFIVSVRIVNLLKYVKDGPLDPFLSVKRIIYYNRLQSIYILSSETFRSCVFITTLHSGTSNPPMTVCPLNGKHITSTSFFIP